MALKLLGKNRQKAKEEEGDNSIDTTESTQSKSPSKHHRRSFNIFNIKIIEIVTVHLTIHLNLEEW